MIYDTHAHYDDDAFAADRAEVLFSQRENGVGFVLNCCTSLDSLTAVPALAEEFSFVFFAAGLHPENLEGLPEDALARVEALLSHPKCLAVGEIGLDYHWDVSPRAVQREWMQKQIALAARCKKPVILHDREAHGDTAEILRAARPRGVLHAFSGSAEMGKKMLSLGLYLGFGGAMTFRNNKKAPEVLAVTPLTRILLETDCPYMAPVPLRGSRNVSGNLRYVAQWIAQGKGISTEEVLRVTAQNARDLFGCP